MLKISSSLHDRVGRPGRSSTAGRTVRMRTVSVRGVLRMGRGADRMGLVFSGVCSPLIILCAHPVFYMGEGACEPG